MARHIGESGMDNCSAHTVRASGGPNAFKLPSRQFCQRLPPRCASSMPLASNQRKIAPRHQLWSVVRPQHGRRPIDAHERAITWMARAERMRPATSVGSACRVSSSTGVRLFRSPRWPTHRRRSRRPAPGPRGRYRTAATANAPSVSKAFTHSLAVKQSIPEVTNYCGAPEAAGQGADAA